MSDNNNQDSLRKFGLSILAINNRTSVFILTFIICIMGMISYVSMPKESFPEIVIPTIYVGTVHPGNSPVDMENLITRPIEKELKSLSGIKSIKSTSIQDFSTIIVEFNPDEEVEDALRKVKDAVDKSKSELPSDLDRDPNVFEINFSEFPVLNINLSGNYSIEELNEYAEFLENEIEKLSEVSKAEIKGTREREIRIDCDLHKMEARQVNFNDIAQAIGNENITISGGNILTNQYRRTLRVDGEFKNVDQIKNVIVKSEQNNIIYLRDIAEVKDTYEESESYARERTLPVVTVDVVKRSGENLIIAIEKINDILREAKASKFPKDLIISTTNDQSRMVKSQLDNLENSIISGVILVVLVLMFFLNIRNALFVGIAIPLSMFMAFMILNAFGVTLNIMVLFSLVLALGMLVDNGIVVVENIYRHVQEGKSAIQAAKMGVSEVALPIITSTLTTLAAFLPLAFWSGIMGEFMKFLPITLIITLSSSLFVALVINPVLTSVFMKEQEGKVKGIKLFLLSSFGLSIIGVGLLAAGFTVLGNLILIIAIFIPFNIFIINPSVKWFQDVFLNLLENIYAATLSFALSRFWPYIFFFGTSGLFIVSNGVLQNAGLKVAFFPVGEPQYINIFIQKPIGTDIESTNKLTKEIEAKVIKMMEPYDFMVESIIGQVGKGTTDPNEGPSNEATPHKSKITVSFVEFQYRKGISTGKIMEEIRQAMTIYPGVEITVDKNAEGPPVGKPINIEVSGENYPKLIQLTNDIKKTIDDANIPGIEQLKTDLELGKPELLVNIDREQARRFGLSTGQIANELRTALFGYEVSKFKDGEDDYPIQLRLKDDQRYDVDALLNKRITFRDMFGNLKQIPIASVASFEYSSTYGSVKRVNLNRVITIFSNVKKDGNANEIVNEIKFLLSDYPVPEGFDIKFTGEQEQQDESSAFLMNALLIAVFSIFLIIVSQFNSFITPFIIMCSVLLSTIGVFFGLVIFEMDFIIIMTGIGIISLAGVVVNNAIVLIDYTNLIRKQRKIDLGLGEDDILPYDEIVFSIVEGGKKRLRPVLLTAITTILGLIPLAVGLNINFFTLLSDYDPQFYVGGDNVMFWGPLSWTVIFGLTFATFLTLVIVPVMYLLAHKLSMIGRKRD